MILKLSDQRAINLLQACYWQERKPMLAGDGKQIEIVFPGETVLILTKEETASFERMLQQMAQPKLVQPAGNLLVP